MKKNLTLFAVLIALITGIYFFQEKRVEKEYVENLTKDKLIQGEINQIKFQTFEAIKKDGQWWAGDILLSSNTMKLIEKKLKEVTEFKAIEGNPETFFTNPLVIEVNREKVRIGDLSLDKQGFYISKGNKISLAFIDGESMGTSTREADIEAGKVNEFQALLVKDLPELKESQFFRFYPELPKDKVVMHAEGSAPYEIHIKDRKTVPAPIKGINVHQDLNGKLMSVLTQIFIKNEIPYSEKYRFKKLATMVFSAAGTETVTWNLWLKSKDSGDSVILDDDRKKAFLMVGGSLKPFFLHVQDFWDKKIIPPSEFKGFSRLPVTFTEGDKQSLVTVIDREPLDFETTKYKVKPGNMQDLFQFLLNLGQRDQADRVSQLSTSERKQYLSENRLKIELMNQELLCFRKNDELIVANLTQGFKAHFMLPFEKLHCRFSDVLE